MNDRYLFRGKHIHMLPANHHLDGGWIYGYLSDENYINSPELEGEFLVDKDTICQCTGLKDKNGKLIWENDIIKNTANIYWALQIVKYGACRNWIIDSVRNKPFKASQCGCLVDREATLIFEVIGNIFDSPELLEV